VSARGLRTEAPQDAHLSDDSGHFGAAQLVRALRVRFRTGWLRIPPDDRRRWLRMIGVGTAGMFVLMFAMVEAARALEAAGTLAWEADFLRRLETDGPFSFSTAVWFQTFGTDITLWILVLLTAGIAVWNERPITALSIVLAYIVIDPVVRVGWMLWDRARPDVLYGGVTAPAFHAFPSGHTGKSFAVYGVLIWSWIRSAGGWLEKVVAVVLLAFIGTVVPLGRMTMGVHWPSDIIGGWLLGAIWLGYLIVALRFERRTTLH
jgi:membrane-associated phospholipid phosphatase